MPARWRELVAPQSRIRCTLGMKVMESCDGARSSVTVMYHGGMELSDLHPAICGMALSILLSGDDW